MHALSLELISSRRSRVFSHVGLVVRNLIRSTVISFHECRVSVLRFSSVTSKL